MTTEVKTQLITLPEFIQKKGIRELAATLEVHVSTVYDWSNFKQAPNPTNAERLVGMSRRTLSFNSIYIPFFKKNKK